MMFRTPESNYLLDLRETQMSTTSKYQSTTDSNMQLVIRTNDLVSDTGWQMKD